MPETLDYGRAPRRRSRLGVASCIMALLPWVVIMLLKAFKPILFPNSAGPPVGGIGLFLIVNAAVGVFFFSPVIGIVLGFRGLFVGRRGGWELAWLGFMLSAISGLVLFFNWRQIWRH